MAEEVPMGIQISKESIRKDDQTIKLTTNPALNNHSTSMITNTLYNNQKKFDKLVP